jgi:signal transduction histidine kinase
MDNTTINATDVIIFFSSGLLVICLMFGFILYFLMSYRQKRKDFILLQSQKQEINRQKMILENTLLELKQTQAQLIQSEKMASLGELVAGISHEIQNPLNFVNNFASLNQEMLTELREEIQNNRIEDAMLLVGDIIQNEIRIQQHGKRADGIIKSMLEHSRSSNGQKELVDINVMCEEYIKVANEESTLKLDNFSGTYECIFHPGAGKLELMKQDIGRVLLNLLNNAFYAAHQRWLSEKESHSEFVPKVTIKTERNDDKIEISVMDNGTGINSADINKIFQPFYTTKPTGKGTGLGLSLASDIVRAHGGQISVKSALNEGSVFIIELPAKNIRHTA